MKALLIFLAAIFMSLQCFGQKDKGKYMTLEEALKEPHKARYLYVSGDSAALQQLKNEAEKLQNIAGIVIDGKVELEDLLWESFSHFRLLEDVILRNNQLKRLGIRSSTTMKELWISGSPEITPEKLNETLENSIYLQVLRLHDFQHTIFPSSFKKLTFLKKLEICRSTWTFDQIVENIGNLENLRQLLLPDNHFIEVDKNIKNVRPIQHLDLSGNDLLTISSKVKKLNQLDTLVLNRNAFTNLQDLVPILEQTKIDLLILQNDSTTNKEDFEYLLPGKDIIWMFTPYNSTAFELPHGTTELVKDFETEDLKQTKQNTIAVSSKDVKLFSPAFIRYDQLQFPQALAAIDTLCFNSRYLDSSYAYSVKIEYQNETEDGYYYPLKLDKAHGTYYKKKRKKKIDHKDLSHIRFEIQNQPEGLEDKVFITVVAQPFEDVPRTDLDVFKDIVWEVNDFSSTKAFQEKVMNQKTWSDIRIIKEENSDHYTFMLKGRFENMELNVTPHKAGKINDETFHKKGMPKIFQEYQKDLAKTSAKFDKDLKKKIGQAERKYSKEINAKWEEVQKYMTEEEKKLSRYEWMPYYLKIKGNEFGLIGQEQLEILYLSRFLESRGFTSSKGNDFYIGQKWITFSLKKANQEVLKIQDYCLIDLDRHLLKYFSNQEKTEFLYDGYHNFVLVAKLNDGGFVLLNAEQVQQLCTDKQLIVPESAYVSTEKSNAAVAEMIEKMVGEIKY